MDVTPGTPAKRSRAKTKEPVAEKAVKSSATPKKARASTRKPAVEARVQTSATVTEAVVTMTPSANELQGMIATAAYYLAAERNFSPGHELDDWLEAERRIQATLFG